MNRLAVLIRQFMSEGTARLAAAVAVMSAAMLMSTGCSRFFYTQDEWRILERDMEAVEEELDDIQKDSARKRAELTGYVSQINAMEHERHLYDRTMSRVREAFMQDIEATEDRMEAISHQMDSIEERCDTRSAAIREKLTKFEKDWVERFSVLLKTYCAHWKCSDDGKINEKSR